MLQAQTHQSFGCTKMVKRDPAAHVLGDALASSTVLLKWSLFNLVGTGSFRAAGNPGGKGTSPSLGTTSGQIVIDLWNTSMNKHVGGAQEAQNRADFLQRLGAQWERRDTSLQRWARPAFSMSCSRFSNKLFSAFPSLAVCRVLL